MAHPTTTTNPHLPVPPIRRITRPLTRFLQIESASGVVLLVCTVVALVLANSPFAGAYAKFWHSPVFLEVGTFRLGGELGHFVVNDVLMTIFFFVVGLEIKREIVAGELRDARKAALPIAAALGGMLVPAAIYMGLQAKQFGAVVVIAVFYSGGLNWLALALAACGFGLVYLLNRLGVRPITVYVLVGAGVWLAVYKSGVHPTIAGVLLGLLTPPSAWVGREALRLSVVDLAARIEDVHTDPDAGELQTVAFAARESVSPLERLETGLHPWVGFVIMPLFALANAGVEIELSAITESVSVATALALFLGKPVGVVLFSFLAVRFGIAKLPQGVTWPMLLGGGFLAGIGFTMSLFVAGLAFPIDLHPRLLTDAKIGIILGSLCSAVAGVAILVLALRRERV